MLLKIKIYGSEYLSTTQTVMKWDDDNKEDQQQTIIFYDYTAVGEEKVLLLTISTSEEGVRLMQYTEEAIHYDLGKSKMYFILNHRTGKIGSYSRLRNRWLYKNKYSTN